ncbi:MAG: polymer-forming cytoskeletal protein [Chloroflexota bacterium]|nr:polymer-forming cytoskeletal protein [Chloroflexota bacterium]
MVFRKESKVDAFQRQMSALRQQLGNTDDPEHDGPHEPEEQSSAEESPHTVSFRAVTAPDESPASGSTHDAGNYSFGGFQAGASSDLVQTTGASAGGTVDEEAPRSPAIPPIPTVDTHVSVVAHDAVWRGEFESQGSIHIHGKVEGSVSAKQDIYVAEEADVDATLTAVNVVVAGLIKGTVRCSNRFEVLPAGRVAGDVQAPTLVVHDGATLTGQLRMGNPEPVEEPRANAVQRRAARSGA